MMLAVQSRKVYRIMRGRSEAYPTVQSFVEEAKRLGFSLTAPTAIGKSKTPNTGDLILFCSTDAVVMTKGQAYPVYVFGFGIVEGEHLWGRTELGKTFVKMLLDRAEAEGLVKVVGAGGTVFRRCGHYTIGRQVEVIDWQGFDELAEKLWQEMGKGLANQHVGRMVTGHFYELPSPIVIGHHKWWRGFARVDDVEPLLQALGTLPDSGAPVVLELITYIREVADKESAKVRHRQRAKLYTKRKGAVQPVLIGGDGA